MSQALRKDWDYVTFADYQKDTRELTERAMDLFKFQRKEIRDRERLIYAMVKAAGGKIAVNLIDVFEADKNELVAEEDFATGTRVYMIREKPHG